ncbi:DNA/RNA non-specific endonuclease [Listeria cossartiae subsp. cayugensis]|uniref:DNA/RNA non-specific endonuclease n=1 Tax=Listeria cossartiae subsp. cayugensis TaxID=2713505 RepID=A0ABU2IRH9_9LIST|nr:DNA/RNA non-specific endonuclease [Listeria cossartiae]MDT0067313.1 DNA/RNA non-specific endonuclease [Listeria cossartiae subsp. cayugensis]MDT0081160.1 DNA/RNA non-specific endonuclease [Listeria cossartiae subsp. cayugensis]MDT0083996.1 DNA/RNA non-specific endonuclease [Listeria cossartiae subsp. cayugensis]MDT0089536.1 DNA/RNA non-specific endonuclease [Listeria cossartiae subsp. cayugensis]MDT0100606.1 DNA/RNA non-specific endonuclease [Listeria cossartiae subsp. cayugensis]
MKKIILSFIAFLLIGAGVYETGVWQKLNPNTETTAKGTTGVQSNSTLANIAYDGKNQVIEVNNNVPTFNKNDLLLTSGNFQHFSDLDSLNRVGKADAMLHKSMMPTEKREPLYINPTGWKNKKTANGWLYNRCHLIGYQLTGENNNPKNLMTGTRSFNTPGMLDYENEVASYLRKTNNHVRYRVTPIFKNDELLARGVQIEAQSIEDSSIQFNVYILNVESGVELNYQDGTSKKR